jgi:hypothetical protein
MGLKDLRDLAELRLRLAIRHPPSAICHPQFSISNLNSEISYDY